jgi:hypothetical protein
MRLKRSNSGVRVCVLVSFVVLVALALTATSALALTNPERHYEMVSPPFKDGYAAQPIEAVAQNGESVAYFSPGTFAGRPVGLSEGLNPMPYVARRGASGWSTTPISPPPGVTPDIQGTETQDVSPTLEATTVLGKLGPNYEVTTQNGVQGQAFIHSVGAPDTAANWEAAGPVLEALQKTTIDPAYRGTSANLCHFIIEAGTTDQAPLREQLLPEPLGEFSSHLYEVGRGGGDCGGEPPSLRFVGVNNAGKLISPSCAEGLGSRAEGSPSVISPPSHSSFNAVPAGGREVFFEASTDGCEQLNVYQLFVRVGGVKTIEVSRPLSSTCVEVPCGGAAVAAARASAEFVGASRDGSRVFFTTKAPLVEEDKDEGNDLYMASIGCPAGVGEACEPAEAQNTKVTSLVQVSHDPHGGEAAEVQGVVQLAPDGSHVYFVARGLLGEGSNKQGQSPTKGADNLYVYDSATGWVAFIADRGSGPSDSGVM